AVSIIPALDPVGVPGWPARPVPDPGWHNAFTAWERFDALWFLRIADGGYGLGDGSAAFFPLYPLLTRAASWLLGGRPFAAATLISNGAFLAALVVTYLLTARELGERAARTTIVLLCFFPTSYFFLMPYSESVFLLFAVTAFWGARRERWVLAGVAAGLAALTRSIGIILLPALAVEAVTRRAEGRRPAWPALLAAAGAGVGTLAYLGWWQLRTGDWLTPLTRQQNWQREFSWPWATVWDGTRAAFRYVGNVNGGYWLIDWLVVMPVLGLAVYAIGRLPPSFVVYLWAGLLIPIVFVFPDRPFMSMPRFVLTLFPAFWATAVLVDRAARPIPRWALVGAGAAGLGMLSVLTVNWYYIF
ncbi:MAG TPA: mannosyltransferase family protein, partial [Actinomycetota bacterium]|nr:mannosyltransferase family protein [Actinomycetota bacterium]